MNKPAPVETKTPTNGWKTVRDIAIALAPTVITVVTCAVIVKQLDKE